MAEAATENRFAPVARFFVFAASIAAGSALGDAATARYASWISKVAETFPPSGVLASVVSALLAAAPLVLGSAAGIYLGHRLEGAASLACFGFLFSLGFGVSPDPDRIALAVGDSAPSAALILKVILLSAVAVIAAWEFWSWMKRRAGLRNESRHLPT